MTGYRVGRFEEFFKHGRTSLSIESERLDQYGEERDYVMNIQWAHAPKAGFPNGHNITECGT
jgi:hypothetical protein